MTITESARVPTAPAPRPRKAGRDVWRRRLIPFGYLSPTILLLIVLMAVPIVMYWRV